MGEELVPVSPAALALGNNNDYAGVGASSFARLSADVGGSTLTGVVAPTEAGTGDRILIIVNLANTLTITHQDVLSAAANRFLTATALSLILAADDVAIFIYDSTTARWRQVTSVA